MAIDYTYYTLNDPITRNISCVYRLPDGAIIPLDNNNGCIIPNCCRQPPLY